MLIPDSQSAIEGHAPFLQQAAPQPAPTQPVSQALPINDPGHDGDLPARSRLTGGTGINVPRVGSVPARMERSFFVDEREEPASKIELYGQVFKFDPLSDAARDVYNGITAQVAGMLGLTEREFLDKEIFNSEQRVIKDAAEVNLHDYILEDALRTWSLPRPCNAENKRMLHNDMKRDIAEAIIAFSVHGVSEARFRSLRGEGTGSRRSG